MYEEYHQLGIIHLKCNFTAVADNLYPKIDTVMADGIFITMKLEPKYEIGLNKIIWFNFFWIQKWFSNS